MTYPILGQPNTGDTAWMLASSALVLLMTPGLAFFYGGMVRARSVLNMLMMSISAMGVVTVLWVLYGYSIAFGNDVGNVMGNPTEYWGLKGLIGVNAVAADPSKGTAAIDIPLAGTLPATAGPPDRRPCPARRPAGADGGMRRWPGARCDPDLVRRPGRAGAR